MCTPSRALLRLPTWVAAEAIAAELHVHPQTVRYRMGRIRERYGDRLADPRWILALTVALGLPPTRVGPESVR